MRRLNMLGVALLAVFVFGALAATSAFALPENLPQVTKTWEGKKDGAAPATLELLSGKKVVCAAAKGTGADTSDTAGTFAIDFEKCESESTPCTGEGEATEVILVKGTYHYVYDTLSPTLGVAVLFLNELVKFSCAFGLAKIVVLPGQVVCLILEPTSSKATHLFHCEQEKGDPKEAKWWNDTPTEQTAALKCSFNGAAEESCAELALAEVTFKEAKAFENV